MASERTAPSAWRAPAYAALSGLVYAAAQPGWGLWPLSGVCLVPLLAAFRGRGPGARAALGWWMGTVAAVFAVGPTLYQASTSFFELGVPASLFVSFLVGQLFGAIPFAAFALACPDPSRARALSGALLGASAWVAMEFARTGLATGLPWALLAHALVPAPLLLGGATLAGAYLVSFWLVALNALLERGLSGPERRAPLVAAAVLLLAASGPGWMARAIPEGDATYRVRLVQGDVPESWRRSPSKIARGFERLVELSGDEAVDLVIWPENAVSVLLPANQLRIEAVAGELAPIAPYWIIGAPRVDPDEPTAFRNAAVLVNTRDGTWAHHDKVHLVPFAEYDPWPGAGLGDASARYRPGATPRPLRAGDVTLGPLICYEAIFPALARAQVLAGAELLVNVSNDIWVEGSAGREQHLAAAVLRAVETRRWLVRVTQNGVSAVVDPTGRMRLRLPLDQPAAATVAVSPRSAITPYVRLGDVFAWLCVLVALGSVAYEALRPPRRSRDA